MEQGHNTTMPNTAGPEGIDRRVAARIRRSAARRGGEADAYTTVQLRTKLGTLAMRVSRRRRIVAMLPLVVAAVSWFTLPSIAASNVSPGDRVVSETNTQGDFALWSKFANDDRGGYVAFARDARVAGYFVLTVGSGQVTAYGAGLTRPHAASDVLREATGAGPQISYILSHYAPVAKATGALADPNAEAAAVQLAIYGYTDDALSHPVKGTDDWVAPVDARARVITADVAAHAQAWWNAESTAAGGTLQTGIVLIPVNTDADQHLVYLETIKPAGGAVPAGATSPTVADALVRVGDGPPAAAAPLAGSCAPAQPAVEIGGAQVIAPGASVTYVSEFSNQGTVPIGPSNLTIQVPDGFTISNTQPAGEQSGQDVNYQIDMLAPGQSQTFQVTVTAPASAAAGQVTATAEVATTPQYTDSSCTPVPADTTASTTSTVSPVAGQVEGVAPGGPLTVGSPHVRHPQHPGNGCAR
jgi:hypothetical protein